MSAVQQPLLDTIEPDEDAVAEAPAGKINQRAEPRQAVVLTPTNRAEGAMAASQENAESGIAGIFRQSSHPVSLFFLYLFRIAALAVYILCDNFTKNYVLSTVFVVVLLAMDFWNCRNVSGRTLVGLRYWNQVDDDGESYWVFESRDPSRPANAIDAKMFWIALYTFPALWVVMLLVSFVKLNISFIPIVILALVFNVSNAVGFTYADRDAKARWSNAAAGGFNFGLGSIGGQFIAGAVKNRVGKIFG